MYGIYTNEIEVASFSAGSHLSILLGLCKSDGKIEHLGFTGLIYGVADLKEGIEVAWKAT